jgi:tetratricopeptide (TPR) repeat protein
MDQHDDALEDDADNGSATAPEGAEEDDEIAEAPETDMVDEADSRPAIRDGYGAMAYSGDERAGHDTDAIGPDGNPMAFTPEDRIEKGDRLLKEGQVGEALSQYREAVRSAGDVDSGVSHRTTLGDAYAYSGQAVNAYRQYKRAIKASPRKAEPHFSLAELFQRYGRLQSAIAEYRKAIQFAPTNAYYRYKLGDALALAGDLEGAVSELEETTHLKPQDGFYHFWLGDLYFRAGRMDEAVREMQQATLFSPYDAYYVVRLGALYRRMGQGADAIGALRQAVEITPENGAYHCLLADIYSEEQMDEHAIHHYQMAGRLDAYDLEILRRLRILSGQTAEGDEVIAALAPPEDDEPA